MKNSTAFVQKNTPIGDDYFHLVLDAPEIAREAQPGQFVMLAVNDTCDPLLRRPFSLCGITANCIEILFQICGTGTRLMSKLGAGDMVALHGPLGNGFEVSGMPHRACLVGGGIGIAPLIGLARYLDEHNPGMEGYLFFGAKNKHDIAVLKSFVLGGWDVMSATEDGSCGYDGFVTDCLAAWLNEHPELNNDKTVIYSCGPSLMLKALADTAAKHNLTCQCSLEARMACGVGACMGCAVKRGGQDAAGYACVCSEGPVFDRCDVEWDSQT